MDTISYIGGLLFGLLIILGVMAYGAYILYNMWNERHNDDEWINDYDDDSDPR